MVDKSWGVAGSTGLKVRSNLSLEERAAKRAEARGERAAGHSDGMAQRLEARAALREKAALEREQTRQARREEDARLTAIDPHTAAERRKRGSGRKDIVREQRDTSGYTIVVNPARLRALMERGASRAALSATFNLSAEEIEQMLAEAD